MGSARSGDDDDDCCDTFDLTKKRLGGGDAESARRRRGSLLGSLSFRAFLHRSLRSAWIFAVPHGPYRIRLMIPQQ
jgi:hypothetical protein